MDSQLQQVELNHVVSHVVSVFLIFQQEFT